MTPTPPPKRSAGPQKHLRRQPHRRNLFSIIPIHESESPFPWGAKKPNSYQLFTSYTHFPYAKCYLHLLVGAHNLGIGNRLNPRQHFEMSVEATGDSAPWQELSAYFMKRLNEDPTGPSTIPVQETGTADPLV